ncbi:DUF2690 domain-containing protein [Streptomyces sp. NPDC056309]|uniref:DUF2690 domain-containing protein n=1 Tax=unclassified Streptomyces TaxID=2593676 RepID=UPI0035E187D4
MAAAAVSAMAVAGTLLAAPAATAAPTGAQGTCYGSSCTGKEPNGTTCASDAITAKQITSQGRTIQLRYSPSCRAAWGRILGASVGDWIGVQSSSGSYYERRVTSGSDQHTVMVNDAGITAFACGWRNESVFLGCTASY